MLASLPPEETRRPGPRKGMARRRFAWNEETSEFFSDVVKIKLKMFDEEQPEETAEVYLRSFFELRVKILWPKGWMNARELANKAKPTVAAHA